MSPGLVEVAAAALRSIVGPSCLPLALLAGLAGFLLRPGAGRGLSSAVPWAFAPAMYALVAMGDWGVGWPQLDSPGSALVDLRAWTAILPLLGVLFLMRGGTSWRLGSLPLALMVAMALARPPHDSVMLSHLRGTLDGSPAVAKIFVFHWVQGCFLTVQMAVAALTGEKLVGSREVASRRLFLAGRAFVVLWALALVGGLYGGLCRVWILHWPPALGG